jgi:ubiquinone/menaquinone biosynthesis C-methylase UbiE
MGTVHLFGHSPAYMIQKYQLAIAKAARVLKKGGIKGAVKVEF